MPELPESLQTIVDDFNGVAPQQRLELLLEFADELPEVPTEAGLTPDMLESVPECQSPVAVRAVLHAGIATIYVMAPPSAPTTRGFGSILAHGLSGLTAQQVLDVDDGFPDRLGLRDVVSMLRLNGMHAMLARIKRQIAETM